MNAAGIAEGTYDNLKDYITVISWRDSSCSNRSPININTADEVVIKAVLKGTGLSDASVDTAYAAISINQII
jgi:type II secretory pathway component PulK